MTDIIEKSLDVNIDHKVQMLPLYEFVRLRDCVFRTSIGAKAIAALKEFSFADRFKDLQNTLLYQPIHNRWNTKGSGLTVAFWNFYTAYWLWVIVA